ncbi:MAG: N-acetyl-gamma-glutamyl-phosphate reductase [Solirubrobacterales bacterium]
MNSPSSEAQGRQPLAPDPAGRVVVAGASGYAGALAADLVWLHPGLELASVTARTDAGTRLDDLYPQHPVPMMLEELDLDGIEAVDAAIVAYPHGASAPVVAALRGLGVKVVDLSADFRLRDLPTYERTYGEHGAPELLEGAVYGLPELYRERIAEAELVANPGCYPTASVLALAPLAAAGLIEDVVIDAKSGVSGAGRGVAAEMELVKESDDTRPYMVGGHRHQPEIAQELGALAGAGPLRSLVFVPHLMPFDQGELASCYVRTTRTVEEAELSELYAAPYADEPFVAVLDEPPSVAAVRETNMCEVHAALTPDGRVAAFGAIDNLWKGAASQAIQNLNLMLGLPEGEGIS